MSDWQPIETAPGDSTPILAKSRDAITEACLMFWPTRAYYYPCGGDYYRQMNPQPTHWQPLPS